MTLPVDVSHALDLLLWNLIHQYWISLYILRGSPSNRDNSRGMSKTEASDTVLDRGLCI
jgi:hypothetical protein